VQTTTGATLNSTVNPNSFSTAITYRYQTTTTATCNSSTPTSTIAGPSGLTGSSPLSGITTQQSLGSLTAATNYWFCATADNTAGGGGITYGTVLQFVTTPGAPTSPAAAQNGNQQSIALSWTAPSGNGTKFYKIRSCSGSGCTPANPVDTGSSSTSNTQSSLTCGTIYRYTVSAYTVSGGSQVDGVESSIFNVSGINGNGTISSGSTLTCYRDADNDTYTPSGASSVTMCGSCSSGYYATNSGNDCMDTNSNVHPGQASYFTIPTGNGLNGGYDFDCNNSSVGNLGGNGGDTVNGRFSGCSVSNLVDYDCSNVPPDPQCSCGASNGGYYNCSGGVTNQFVACGGQYGDSVQTLSCFNDGYRETIDTQACH
jgi:hypothetical protein